MSSVGSAPGITAGINPIPPQQQPSAQQVGPQPGYYAGAVGNVPPSADVGNVIPPVKI